ncbi:hypothetical protein GCM10009765_33310 [Fodinicola feengrottensis]|uniref:LRAT domain-containing protein n=1 Tax=Fodinicola feengrottensis TaxID=435914 RepID=A0ABP4T334_9ACTN
MRDHLQAGAGRTPGGTAPIRDQSPRPRLLDLQRTAGNAAVVAALGLGRTEPAGKPAVQRAASDTLSGWKQDAQPADQYEMTIKTMNRAVALAGLEVPDLVGHAWITLRQLSQHSTDAKPPGAPISIGFWPESMSGLDTVLDAFYNDGKVASPDPHEGDEDHAETTTIDHKQFLAVTGVVQAYESLGYSMAMNNCATFARRAWNAGTGRLDLLDQAKEIRWIPLTLATQIAEDNKKKGRDAVGHQN